MRVIRANENRIEPGFGGATRLVIHVPTFDEVTWSELSDDGVFTRAMARMAGVELEVTGIPEEEGPPVLFAAFAGPADDGPFSGCARHAVESEGHASLGEAQRWAHQEGVKVLRAILADVAVAMEAP